MVQELNCTLEKSEWVTEGTVPALLPCQNQTGSFAKILDADFGNILKNCDTPCQWTHYSPRLTNFDDTFYVASYEVFLTLGAYGF